LTSVRSANIAVNAAICSQPWISMVLSSEAAVFRLKPQSEPWMTSSLASSLTTTGSRDRTISTNPATQ